LRFHEGVGLLSLKSGPWCATLIGDLEKMRVTIRGFLRE
jgi:hypothetical protein